MVTYIPLIQTQEIRKHKQISDIFTSLNEGERKVSTTYLLDNKGISKNHPSLSLHQYVHRWFDTIVDAGCQHIGDVVDVLLAGADKVVLRPQIWQERDFLSIRDISESQLFIWYDPQEKRNNHDVSSLLVSQADGAILNLDKIPSPLPFTVRDTIRELISTFSPKKVIVFNPSYNHKHELDVFGLHSIIVNVNKILEKGKMI